MSREWDAGGPARAGASAPRRPSPRRSRPLRTAASRGFTAGPSSAPGLVLAHSRVSYPRAQQIDLVDAGATVVAHAVGEDLAEPGDLVRGEGHRVVAQVDLAEPALDDVVAEGHP